MMLFKSAKFEDKMKILNESLSQVERRLNEVGAMRFGFDTLDEIEREGVRGCDEASRQLAAVKSNELDEFKELCEKVMETCCESAGERALVEKRMDAVVLKWTLLDKRADETRVNLAFLARHLTDLDADYRASTRFLASLNLKYIDALSLNCVDPIVIKHQYERMRESNESMAANAHLFRSMFANTSDLLALYESFESRQVEDEDELNENRYVGLLPKTISSACVKMLVEMIDQPDVEQKVAQVEAKFNDYQVFIQL